MPSDATSFYGYIRPPLLIRGLFNMPVSLLNSLYVAKRARDAAVTFTPLENLSLNCEQNSSAADGIAICSSAYVHVRSEITMATGTVSTRKAE
jgi:hypothetical protein